MFDTITSISPASAVNYVTSVGNINKSNSANQTAQTESENSISFLDVFKNVISEAYLTNAQKSQDAIDVAIGNVDDIERIQANIAKAEVATELLVTVKNSVVDAYNEIFRMSV